MEEIKRLQIEDALKADLSGSRAKSLSELLTESDDLSKSGKGSAGRIKVFRKEHHQN